MTSSKIFLYFCLSFIGGIFVGSVFFVSQVLLLSFIVIGLILISVLWRYKKLVIFGFCVLFLVFGIWRHQNSELQITNSKLQIYNDTNEKISLIGIVSEEPDIKEKVIRLTIEVRELNKEESNGKLLITTNRYPEYKYGDKLEISGKLKTPSEDLNGFNYKDYLQKDGIYSVMEWPKIELKSSNLGNPIMKIIYSFKNKFKEVCRKFISPPQLGLLEALVFGDEQNFSQEFKNKLNITGTRHIAAVSGMNITIISSLILNFILLFGLWRRQAFYLAIILLIIYILMIGAPASAVRAGILGGLFMIGQNLGRFSTASRAVVFAATFMLLLNPFLLRLDIGFQLSFLAILGIIFLQPIFSSFFQKILPIRGSESRILDGSVIGTNPKIISLLTTTLSSTLSAQVFTLPILIYNFGYITLISPITNILIVPFLAPITILIFIFGISGMIFLPLSYIFSWLTWLFLNYIISVIDWFSKIPFATINIQNISWILIIIYYFFALLFIFWWQRKERNKLLNY